MAIVNLHIDRFNKPSKFWVINILGTTSLFFNFLRLRFLRNLFIRGMNKDLSGLLKSIKSTVEVSKHIDAKIAIKAYPLAKEALFSYRRTMAKFEKRNYFGSNTTQKLSESILDNFYSLELNIRLAAFDNSNNGDDEKELVEFASRVSLHSLSTN